MALYKLHWGMHRPVPALETMITDLRSLAKRRAGTRAWTRTLIEKLNSAGDLHVHSGLIAARLNAANITTIRGGRWQQTSVDRLLMIGTLQSATDDRVADAQTLIEELGAVDRDTAAHYRAELDAVLAEIERGAAEARAIAAELHSILSERTIEDAWLPVLRGEEREKAILEDVLKKIR